MKMAKIAPQKNLQIKTNPDNARYFLSIAKVSVI